MYYKDTPQCQVLVLNPAFHPSYILRRDPQERLKSNKPLNRTVPSQLVGHFISSHSGMPRDPIWPHSVSSKDIVERLLALSYHLRRCFGSLKRFQSRLAIGANANKVLWPVLSFNFMTTG
jgi:hypothetical protein